MHSYSLGKCKGGGGVMRMRKKKELDHRGGGVVDLKCRRVCRRSINKSRSGVIVAKEI